MNIRNIKTYLYAVKLVKTCSVNLNSTMSKSILFFLFQSPEYCSTVCSEEFTLSLLFGKKSTERY